MSDQYGSDWPPGTVIRMYDETLRIRENHGDRGVVEYLDGEPVSSNFHWTYQGDKAELITLPNPVTASERGTNSNGTVL